MGNYTGSSITPSMVAYYIKTINDAFIYFNTDYSNNTAYIVNRLEGAYTAFFDVIIMTENVTGDFLVYSANSTSTVCWSNVNTAKPSWVYIINAKGTTGIQKYTYSITDIGDGINATFKLVITNVLRDTEGTGPCSCRNLSRINELI